ncbi:MAG: flagellar biosynthesis protein FlhF [Proteobacteria bacterium]|nr:flagellar biosynthesis protein FlhF [Pseudomonadota bacterium]
MRIKRFEAPDSRTAFAMVKKELGEEAVILANKTLDAGTANQRYEVVAAMDYDLEAIAVASENSAGSPAGGQPAIYGYESFRRKKAEGSQATPQKAQQPAKNNEISFEANDLRLRFASLLRQKGIEPPARNQPKPPVVSPLPKAKTRPDPEEVSRWRNQLIEQLQIRPPAINKAKEPVILVLTGPTGVGKTTTSAKIAAWYKLRENCKVALLSMDCYRIGATDQIRTYARIMQIPCEIVLRKNDLRKAVDRHRDCDLIIIDTAGKSPYDMAHIDELASWLSDIEGTQPQLVLSATTKKEDLKHIIEAYASLGPTGLILTKLDETRAYAALCQQIAGVEIPISYIATGQRVPEDFIIASKPFLEKLFKQGWNAVLGNENSYSASGS